MFHRLHNILCTRICCWAVLIATVTGGWSHDFLSRTHDLSCRPGDLKTNVTFIHAMRSGHFTKLGKAADMEVCALLCCEIDKCDAAFMARNYCYSVTCYSEHHCATAPARNNIEWQPMITFVQRLQSNKASIKNKNGSKQEGGVFSSNRQVTGSSLVKTSNTANTKLNKQLLKQNQDHMLYGEDVMRESKVSIHAEDENEPTELDALERKPSAQYQNYHQKNPRSARYSLISAGVVTCLMAFLLSGFAVAAARIRKGREMKDQKRTGDQYSELPTEE